LRVSVASVVTAVAVARISAVAGFVVFGRRVLFRIGLRAAATVGIMLWPVALHIVGMLSGRQIG
jgi:hypothetical protein